MKVSVEQIINRTKIRLLLTGTTHADAVLEKLINEAATWHLNSLDSYIVSCETIDIDCGKARLPEACVDLLCYSFPDATGCTGCCIDCMNPHNANAACSCPTWFVADRNILTEFCGMGTTSGLSSNYFGVQGGYVVFPDTVTQSTVKVWYRGINVDDQGIAVMDEVQERALSAYAAYQYALTHFRSYAPEQRREWRNEWLAQKNFIRGKAFLADFRMHKITASAIARAIIVNSSLVANRNS